MEEEKYVREEHKVGWCLKTCPHYLLHSTSCKYSWDNRKSCATISGVHKKYQNFHHVTFEGSEEWDFEHLLAQYLLVVVTPPFPELQTAAAAIAGYFGSLW